MHFNRQKTVGSLRIVFKDTVSYFVIKIPFTEMLKTICLSATISMGMAIEIETFSQLRGTAYADALADCPDCGCEDDRDCTCVNGICVRSGLPCVGGVCPDC